MHNLFVIEKIFKSNKHNVEEDVQSINNQTDAVDVHNRIDEIYTSPKWRKKDIPQ